MAPKRSRISDPKYVDDALPAARAPSESSTPAPKKNVHRPTASKALSKPKTSPIPPPPKPKARLYAPECFRLSAMGVNEDDIPGVKNLDRAVAVACIEAMTTRDLLTRLLVPRRGRGVAEDQGHYERGGAAHH